MVHSYVLVLHGAAAAFSERKKALSSILSFGCPSDFIWDLFPPLFRLGKRVSTVAYAGLQAQ